MARRKAQKPRSGPGYGRCVSAQVGSPTVTHSAVENSQFTKPQAGIRFSPCRQGTCEAGGRGFSMQALCRQRDGRRSSRSVYRSACHPRSFANGVILTRREAGQHKDHSFVSILRGRPLPRTYRHNATSINSRLQITTPTGMRWIFPPYRGIQTTASGVMASNSGPR